MPKSLKARHFKSAWAKRLKNFQMRTSYNVDPQFFNIAKNLFGVEAPAQKQLKDELAITGAINTDDTKDWPVYPSITGDAFAQTMNNYRRFVALKNFQAKAENEIINAWNQSVRIFKKENPVNGEQKTAIDFFIKKHKAYEPTQYNEQVEIYANQYGMLFWKKKILTIKPSAELVFQNFLCLYNQQLRKKNTRYISCGITTRTPLDPFKVNAWKVTQLKRNEVKSLDLCRKTILNHRKRFEEFGIFTDYHFAGSNRAVQVMINTDILVIKDLYTSKITFTDNQCVTPENGKIVPNDNEKFTGTYIKEEQKNEKVQNFSPDKEFPSVTPFILTFTGTPINRAGNQTSGGGAGDKISKTLPERAIDTIISDAELASSLTNCEFNNYCPIDIRSFHSLAYNSTLTREEFFDVAMIDFFKTLQKNLYKKQNVYFGSWLQAIKLFRKVRWQLFNGDVFQKTHIAQEITQYRWRIGWARNWFAKNANILPLFPNQYLDPTRKQGKEIGFEFTKAKWKAQKDDTAKYDALIKKQEAAAKKRGEMINHSKKMETQLNRFFKNKITLTQLFDFTERNLPPRFREKLPDLIETKALALTEKTFKVKFTLDDF